MLALIGVTLFVIFRDTSLGEIWSAVQTADPLWLAWRARRCVACVADVRRRAAYRAARALRNPISLLRNIGFGYVGQYYTSDHACRRGGQPMQLYYMLAYGVEVSYASLSLLLVNAAHQLVVLLIPTVLFPFRASLILDNLGAFLWLFILAR